MKILTWNVWYKEKPQNILKLLENTEWDVCCLQEITKGSHPEQYRDVADYLEKSLGVYSHFMVAQSWDKNTRSQGNMILSKIPFSNTFSHFIQEFNTSEQPSFSDEGRVVTGVELQIPSKIKILTTHMSYTPEFTETEKKNLESKQLLDYLKKIEGVFVIAGDFNAVPSSSLVKELDIRYKNLSPDFTNSTWTTKPFSHQGFEVNKLSYRLDYIFGSKQLELLSSEVINTNFSDHLPVSCDIKTGK